MRGLPGLLLLFHNSRFFNFVLNGSAGNTGKLLMTGGKGLNCGTWDTQLCIAGVQMPGLPPTLERIYAGLHEITAQANPRNASGSVTRKRGQS